MADKNKQQLDFISGNNSHGENVDLDEKKQQEKNKHSPSAEDIKSGFLSLFKFGGEKISKPESKFETVRESSYDLSFTCLLIPRFPGHQLIGDVVLGLQDRMMQICIAYSWRLEYVSVQSDYMEWIISVTPSTSTKRMMNLIRKQTSKYIFEEFPRFSHINPAGDFWAPGYLINIGSQNHSQSVIKQFNQETRREQGLL